MNGEHPNPLADDLHGLVLETAGYEFGVDAMSALGGWQRITDQAASLIDDPLLVPLVSLAIREAKDGDFSAVEGLKAVTRTVLSTSSPAGFGDGLSLLVSSPNALAAIGDSLVDDLSAYVARFQQLDSPDIAAVSRAADAIEALTRLNVGGFGSPFALFAILEKFRAPAPRRLATAAIRAVGTAIDHWPHALTLTEVVLALAGVRPATGPAISDADAEAIASDASWVLASIDLVHALRTDDLVEMSQLIDSSRAYLEIASDTYDREDAAILGDVLAMVSALLLFSGNPPTVEALDTPLLAPEKVDALVDRATRFNLPTSGLEHWYGDAKRSSLVAWVALASDLRKLHETFAQESFYRAEVVVDDLLQIYVASRSTLVVKRDEDLGGVLHILQPVIESGFAAKAGLLAHLEQHVHNLEERSARADDTEADLSTDLGTAREVLVSARSVALRGDSGKDEGSGPPDPLPKPLDRLFPSGSVEAAKIARLGSTALEKLSNAVENQGAARKLGLLEAQVVKAIQSGLTASPDYRGRVAAAVDQLLVLLVRFVADRSNAQFSRKGYLFDADASEDDLHQDLYDYLQSSELGATTEMEVQHVGGGRVDIRIRFEDFGLHVELKADGTRVAMADKTAYVKQAVAYQATDVRIGFLLALRTKAFDPTGPSPHLTALFEHTTFEVPEDPVPRHIVLVQVPGNRTNPSSMK
jgi:hypothetical protein